MKQRLFYLLVLIAMIAPLSGHNGLCPEKNEHYYCTIRDSFGKKADYEYLYHHYMLSDNPEWYHFYGGWGGDNALTYRNDTLFYNKAGWFYGLLNPSHTKLIHPEKLRHYELHVPDSVICLLSNLVEDAVNASSPLFSMGGSDMDEFVFAHGEHAARGVHCEAGRFMEECCRFVQMGCADSIIALMPQCREFIRGYRRDYPRSHFMRTPEEWEVFVCGGFSFGSCGIPLTDIWDDSRNISEETQERIKENVYAHLEQFVDMSQTIFTDSELLLWIEYVTICVDDSSGVRMSIEEYQRFGERRKSAHLFIPLSKLFPDVIQSLVLSFPYSQVGTYHYDNERKVWIDPFAPVADDMAVISETEISCQ